MVGFPINPPTLFWVTQNSKNAKFSETLTFKKMATGFDLGGHHFIVLDCAINNAPVFVSAVVTYRKKISGYHQTEKEADIHATLLTRLSS